MGEGSVQGDRSGCALLVTGPKLARFLPGAGQSVKLASGIAIFVKCSEGFREFKKNSYLSKNGIIGKHEKKEK